MRTTASECEYAKEGEGRRSVMWCPSNAHRPAGDGHTERKAHWDAMQKMVVEWQSFNRNNAPSKRKVLNLQMLLHLDGRRTPQQRPYPTSQ